MIRWQNAFCDDDSDNVIGERDNEFATDIDTIQVHYSDQLIESNRYVFRAFFLSEFCQILCWGSIFQILFYLHG